MSDNEFNFINNKEYDFNQINNPFENLKLADKVSYKNKLKELNLTLTMNQLPELNDFFDTSFKAVMRNLKTIQIILEDRLKLMEQKNELNQKISKIEGEQLNNNDKADILNNKVKELNSKIEFFKNKLSMQEKKSDKEIDKISKEKEEVQKAYTKISLKENQYKHEIKKLENSVEELKTKLKKYMNDNKEIRISDNNNEKIIVNNNSIIFDNFLKNSPSIIFNHVNYSRDFYSLLYKCYEEKIKNLVNENKELRDCFRFLKEEIIQYVDFKQILLFKLAQDKLDPETSPFKDCANIINKDIFNLDFEAGKNEVLQYFNEIIENFRSAVVYDIYKVNPKEELDFEEVKSQIKNNKYTINNIPYYNRIKETVENLNLDKLEEIVKQLKSTSKIEKKKLSIDNQVDPADVPIVENDVANQLDELFQDITVSCHNLDENFKVVEDDLVQDIRSYGEMDYYKDDENLEKEIEMKINRVSNSGYYSSQ
jgi:hypothetical protein